ncbi:MAG: glycosyltransferase [Candidatus Altiarchaeota archaeon]|nr:glycosyltransferase [Candidatus Altiarchaeota archaeon]
MKLSIVTVALNSGDTIRETIESVLSQSYSNFEYIIVDGGSKDKTLDIVDSYGGLIKLVNGPDRGIYDAMNKGIKKAKGDAIGFLNSDDLYMNKDVLKNIASVLEDKYVDSCYGDIVYVKRNDLDCVVRYWKAGKYNKNELFWGWMPPHTTFFVKKGIYQKYGDYSVDLKISSDYEMALRLLGRFNISIEYIPDILVKMRAGGLSFQMINFIQKYSEDYLSWKINGLGNDIQALAAVTMKKMMKIPQYFKKPLVESK